MRVGVPAETLPGERRVALVPDGVARLKAAGCEVLVQQGAGQGAFFPDEAYGAAGATLVPQADAALGADLVLKVQGPTAGEVAQLSEGAILVSFLAPGASPDLLGALAARRVTAFAMERVPRITRAQSMDALSSQANLAGYQAVLLGASHLAKILPMMTTAAGTIRPARAFVIGAGVAGLQAIATARRLGAMVSAFDVRAVVKEQVQSLGASFLEAEPVSGEGAGGYAKELAADQQARVLEAIGRHIKDQDLVVSTAAIPGKAAPRLVTEAMVRTMRGGSVIVDLAAETGGNCECTRPGETVRVGGVTVLGPLNVPSTLPLNASQVYSRNVLTLLEHLGIKEGAPRLDLAEEITGAMVVVHQGEVRKP